MLVAGGGGGGFCTKLKYAGVTQKCVAGTKIYIGGSVRGKNMLGVNKSFHSAPPQDPKWNIPGGLLILVQ